MARKKADEINLNGYQDSNYDNLTVSDTDYSECSVSGADNVLSESASDNKKVFDTFPKMIAAKFNGLIKKLKNGNFVQDENYVHTDNNFTDEHKETVDNLPGDVSNIKEQLKTGNFVQDANYVHTDNNFTDDYKGAVDVSCEHAFAAMSIAQGANQAVSFNNYQEMVEFFNKNPNWGFVDNFEKRYNIGQNIMIGTVNVPDLWIAETAYDVGFEEYNYVSDEDFIKDINSALENGEFLRVGYVRLGVLETQKVDLTDYVKDKNYVHTDNNFSNDYKDKIEKNSDDISGAIEIGSTAVRIAQGANQAKSFSNYAEMVEWFNRNLNWGEIDNVMLDYQIGQNIMIGTVNVPDLWIASEASAGEYMEYSYSNDETFVRDLINALENGRFLRVGYVTLGVLETQKVDLGIFYTVDEVDYLFERKGRYASYIGNLHPTPNDVYQITHDTNIYLPALTSEVKEFYFSVDTKEGENEGVGPQIVFSLPKKFKWLTDVTFEPNRHYEIAIRGDCGVIADFGEVSE